MGTGGRSGGGGGGGAGAGAPSTSQVAGALPSGEFPGDDTYSAARAAMGAIRDSRYTQIEPVAPTNADVGSLGGSMATFRGGDAIILAGPRDGSPYSNPGNRRKPMVSRVGVVTTPTGSGGTGDSSAMVRFAGSRRSVRVRPGNYDVFSVPRPRALEIPAGRTEPYRGKTVSKKKTKGGK